MNEGAARLPAPSNLASTLTHAELPVELVCEQGVRQLSEVELAEGGHAVDVLQEGGARQFRDPLTVKLMPEATRSRRRKIRVRASPPGRVLPPPPKVSTGGCNPLPVLGSSEALRALLSPPFPQQPYVPKTRAPHLQRRTLRWEMPCL